VYISWQLPGRWLSWRILTKVEKTNFTLPAICRSLSEANFSPKNNFSNQNISDGTEKPF